jgi:DNA-binding Lrp family transcriptional regulator
MVQAVVLIQAKAGRAAQVLQAVEKVQGVTVAMLVTGPYDVVVQIQADDVDAVGKLVAERVQSVVGIATTLTCLEMAAS